MEVVHERDVPATQRQQHSLAHNKPDLGGDTAFSNAVETIHTAGEHVVQP